LPGLERPAQAHTNTVPKTPAPTPPLAGGEQQALGEQLPDDWVHGLLPPRCESRFPLPFWMPSQDNRGSRLFPLGCRFGRTAIQGAQSWDGARRGYQGAAAVTSPPDWRFAQGYNPNGLRRSEEPFRWRTRHCFPITCSFGRIADSNRTRAGDANARLRIDIFP